MSIGVDFLVGKVATKRATQNWAIQIDFHHADYERNRTKWNKMQRMDSRASRPTSETCWYHGVEQTVQLINIYYVAHHENRMQTNHQKWNTNFINYSMRIAFEATRKKWKCSAIKTGVDCAFAVVLKWPIQAYFCAFCVVLLWTPNSTLNADSNQTANQNRANLSFIKFCVEYNNGTIVFDYECYVRAKNGKQKYNILSQTTLQSLSHSGIH